MKMKVKNITLEHVTFVKEKRQRVRGGINVGIGMIGTRKQGLV